MTGSHNSTALLQGSTLLLIGRLLSKAVNFGVQVAIVRMLTKDDFGAFAYGLALVTAGELIVKLGIGPAANRFVPYFYERGEYDKVLGTLALVLGSIFVISIVGYLALLWVAGQGLSGFVVGESIPVVLVLALLAPINAIDQVCVQTLACFAKPKQIFYRKHVLGPGLRVLAVVAAFLAGARNDVLAEAYLIAGIVGAGLCLSLVLNELYRATVLPRPVKQWSLPWRTLSAYALPLITNDLVAITITGVTTVFLMAAGGASEIASMRAVAPAAALNMVVVQSFVILYLPVATRLFARGDHASLSANHWETVAWTAVFSFPIFVLTFSIAPDFVALVFGEEYADAAPVLAILSFSSYFAVVLGFSSETLQITHRTSVLALSNVMMIIVAIVLGWWLCGPYGALGAAVAVAVARILGAVARQWYLLRSGVVGKAPTGVLAIWWRIFAASLATFGLGWLWQPNIGVQVLIAALVCLWLLKSSSRMVDVAKIYPALLKLPLAGWLLNAPSR